MRHDGRRFLVSPTGFDDIGLVLDGMGEGFDHQVLAWEDLRQEHNLAGASVLFMNCAGEAADSQQAQRLAPILRRFVAAGGSLYASDWAGAVIEAAFPGKIEFDQQGGQAQATCRVVDEGLQEIIGRDVAIHFDMGGWWRVRRVSSDARVYVTWADGTAGREGRPIIVGFAHEQGHVIYTSFHNRAQVSEAEQKVLRFLVLRPIMAGAAASAADVGRARLFGPSKEIIDTVNAGERTPVYACEASGGERLLYVVQWEGNGTLKLTVRDPHGTIQVEQTGQRPPLQYEVAQAAAGTWNCQVEGLSLPYNNFPFVLTVAKGVQARERLDAAVPPAQWKGGVGQGQGSYTKPWGRLHPGCLILLLDQSGSMDEKFGGLQIGAGKRKADAVATMLNALLYEFIKANTVGLEVRSRADIAVLGYEGSTVRSALAGPLGAKEFVTLPDLLANPLRIETRMSKEVEEGRVLEVPVQFPIWVAPQVGSVTPMCAALERARALAEQWTARHADSYPPVIINITDGASTDGDPSAAAVALCQVRTGDGAALLFNCHITNVVAVGVEFPSSASAVPAGGEELGRALFGLSSIIPDAARQAIATATGQVLDAGARGFIYNGDGGSIRQMFTFATIGATQRVNDPNL